MQSIIITFPEVITTVEITDVLPKSRAQRAGIAAGDILVSVNGHDISDVLDYRFYLTEKKVELEIDRGGERFFVTVEKDAYDDIGLGFGTPLMDKKHRCENKCIFCFIDQNPPGLRESLYFKDDDSRLSFLHGNYVTLTNMRESDIDRICEMHLSPVNVSVHTTNPDLRRMMMNNKRAGEVLSYLDRLASAGIKLRGQIVLCRGVNDGAELDRTMRDLYALYPAMDSVSVVPAGMTAYRDGLYPLEDFSPEECAGVIAQVTEFADRCEKECGERIFFAADELYVKSGTPLPPYEKWGEFTQIENGVGMLASFEHEFETALAMLTAEDRKTSRTVSVATGEAAYRFICSLCDRLRGECPEMKIGVYCVKNNFFGGHVTVTGLITGCDLAEQLAGEELGEELILSSSMLRAQGDLFLDSMTPTQLSEKLGVKLTFTENDGAEFLFALLGQ